MGKNLVSLKRAIGSERETGVRAILKYCSDLKLGGSLMVQIDQDQTFPVRE